MQINRCLTYATVCSGIECMSAACADLPMKPIFFSEIEPFPCAVLKAHYPDVPNLGDMSKIQVSQDGKEITNGTIRLLLDSRLDILAGGTPCQDVSIAGKRAGMQEGSGTRSSLAFDFVRLARELRPRWVLWENVAGSIDSKNAPDFLRFVGALGGCGYTIAWRVLDAQYVRVDGMERAVPQRRRRVWVVGCLGADESVPAQILFEPDSIAGHTAPRRRAGQGFAYSLAGRDRVDAGVVGNAAARGFRSGSFGQFVNDETCGTLDCEHMNSAANGTPAFAVHDAIALDGDKLKPREDQRKGGNGFGINEEGAGYTLTGVDRHGVAYGIDAKRTWWNSNENDLLKMRYIVRRLTPTEVERLMGLPDGYTIPVGLDPNDPALVAEFQRIFDTFGAIMYEYALASYERSHQEGEPPPKPPKPKSANQVRTWLQKIADPDTCPDSPRYKACGNGWATNQPRWILTRLLTTEGVEW